MKKVLLVLASVVFVSCSFKGDEGGAAVSTPNETVTALKVDPMGDSDGDGLKDQEELNVGRNPFVADLPDLKIRFLQNYKIEVTYHKIGSNTLQGFVIDTKVKDTDPDYKYRVGKGTNELVIAVEVELFRKDRKRVFDKFLEYAKADEYDNVLYFFADRASFESYKKRLNELQLDTQFDHLKEELSQKIVFVLNQSILKNVVSLSRSEVFHNHVTKELGDLIG